MCPLWWESWCRAERRRRWKSAGLLSSLRPRKPEAEDERKRERWWWWWSRALRWVRRRFITSDSSRRWCLTLSTLTRLHTLRLKLCIREHQVTHFNFSFLLTALKKTWLTWIWPTVEYTGAALSVQMIEKSKVQSRNIYYFYICNIIYIIIWNNINNY